MKIFFFSSSETNVFSMNEQSPDIIEQAFLYASVLPLSPCTEDIEFDTSLQATEQNCPNYSNGNFDFALPRFDLTTQPLDCDNLTKSYDIENLGEDIADIEINAFEYTADSDVNQLQATSGTAEVHSDSCSGMENDVRDFDTIDYTCLQQQNDSSVDAPSSTKTDVGNKKKRRRKREKNPGPPPEPILPPCSICEEKSSGYHYGANTCEACKVTFTVMFRQQTSFLFGVKMQLEKQSMSPTKFDLHGITILQVRLETSISSDEDPVYLFNPFTPFTFNVESELHFVCVLITGLKNVSCFQHDGKYK